MRIAWDPVEQQRLERWCDTVFEDTVNQNSTYIDYNIHRLLLPSNEWLFRNPESDPESVGFNSLSLNWKHVLLIQSADLQTTLQSKELVDAVR